MAQRRKSMNKSRGRRMSRGQSRGQRMRGGQEIPPEGSEVVSGSPEGSEVVSGSPEGSGLFDSALSFITSETKPLTDAAKQQKESLNTELKSVAEMSNTQGNSMLESIKSFNPFGTNDPPVAQVPEDIPRGGSSKSSSMRMKGGLNPAFGYNASPVTDSVTAQPTYMMKYTGGKRRRSCKRRSCKRKSCKRRKSCRRKRSCKRRRSKRH